MDNSINIVVPGKNIGELVKIINEEEIGKLKYNLVKRELSKIKSSGRIDSNYKKNNDNCPNNAKKDEN